MNLTLYHPVKLPVRGYGGVERVVFWLAKGLAELGVQVRVAAMSGSLLPPGVALLPLPSNDEGDFLSALGKSGASELVHFMAPPATATTEKLQSVGVHSLVTIHGNGKPGEVFADTSVFLTRDHALRHGADAYVYNGIDPEELHFEPKCLGDSFLFLSRTSWSVKNLSGAMALCRENRQRLRIAGGERPFLLRLRAAWDRRFAWEGTVDGRRKAELLSQSQALLFPIRWPEPFGLVMVESLMSGTPVLATPFGSVPELLSPETGIQIGLGDFDRWKWALQEGWRGLKRERCREWAMERFHYRKMAENYVRFYEKVLNGERINARTPIATDWRKGAFL